MATSFKRVNRGRGHSYVTADGRKLPGVTTILSNGMAKPALISWGMKATSQYAIDHWDELAEMPISKRFEVLKGSAYADRDQAANRGTEVHSYAEKLMRGEEVTPPEEIKGHVESYVRFLDEWEPEPVLVEASVANLKVGYAGSLDLVARFPQWPGENVIGDIKTTRSGIFGEVAFQLSAYAHAESYIVGDTEAPMPHIDRAIAIHVRSDGYDVFEVPIGPKVFRQFCYIAEVAKAAEDAKDYIGSPLRAPKEN